MKLHRIFKLSAVTLGIILGLSQCQEKSQQIEISEEAEQQNNKLKDKSRELREKAEREGLADEDIQELIDARIRLGESMEKAGGSEAKLGRVVRRMANYDQELTKALDVSYLQRASDFGALEKSKDYQGHHDAIESYRKLNDNLMDEIKRNYVLENAKQFSKEEGLTGKDRSDFLAGVADAMKVKLPPMIRIREIDEEVCQNMIKLIDLMKTYDGQWTWDEKQALVDSEDNTFLTKFNELATSNDQLINEQEKAQAQMFGQ